MIIPKIRKKQHLPKHQTVPYVGQYSIHRACGVCFTMVHHIPIFLPSECPLPPCPALAQGKERPSQWRPRRQKHPPRPAAPLGPRLGDGSGVQLKTFIQTPQSKKGFHSFKLQPKVMGLTMLIHFHHGLTCKDSEVGWDNTIYAMNIVDVDVSEKSSIPPKQLWSFWRESARGNHPFFNQILRHWQNHPHVHDQFQNMASEPQRSIPGWLKYGDYYRLMLVKHQEHRCARVKA